MVISLNSKVILLNSFHSYTTYTFKVISLNSNVMLLQWYHLIQRASCLIPRLYYFLIINDKTVPMRLRFTIYCRLLVSDIPQSFKVISNLFSKWYHSIKIWYHLIQDDIVQFVGDITWFQSHVSLLKSFKVISLHSKGISLKVSRWYHLISKCYHLNFKVLPLKFKCETA